MPVKSKIPLDRSLLEPILRRNAAELTLWSSRGAIAGLAVLVTMITVPRLGAGPGADLLVGLAAAQVLAAVLSAPVLTHCFRLGVAGVSARSMEMLSLYRRLVVVAVALTVIGVFVLGATDSRLLGLPFAAGSGGVAIAVTRVFAEWHKGRSEPLVAVALEGLPISLGAALALVVGTRPLMVFSVVLVGCGAAVAIYELVFAGAGRSSAVRRSAVRSSAVRGSAVQGVVYSGREGALIAIVPVGILCATYGPLLWLRAVHPEMETSIASYAVLQRSFAPVTVGLGLVSAIHLPRITSAFRSAGRHDFASAERRSRLFARTRLLPLLVGSVVLAAVSIWLADLGSNEALLAGFLVGSAQLINAVVGIPTEINLSVGAIKGEIVGVVVSVASSIVALALLPVVSVLIVAAVAVLAGQASRNLVSYLNLRAVVAAKAPGRPIEHVAG